MLQRVFAFSDDLTQWMHSGQQTERASAAPLSSAVEPRGEESSATDCFSSLRMVCISGKSSGEIFPIDSPMVRIGRGIDNHIVVSEADVSRYHARLVVRVEGLLIEDLDSKNGTFVNNQRMIKTQTITGGDRIRLGEKLEFLLQNIHSTETC